MLSEAGLPALFPVPFPAAPPGLGVPDLGVPDLGAPDFGVPVPVVPPGFGLVGRPVSPAAVAGLPAVPVVCDFPLASRTAGPTGYLRSNTYC